VRKLGANLLQFFGVQDGPTKSWRQVIASCEHAFMGVPASDPAKRARLGRAMQRYITRVIGDIGKRIDLVRFTAKHDAVGPRHLLPEGRGGASEEFAEAVARISDDQKRKRSAAADAGDAAEHVRLPAETRELAAAAAEPPAKRQQQQQQPTEAAARPTVSSQPQPETRPAHQPAQGATGSAVAYSPLTLQAKGGRGAAIVTIHVDTKGALRWLNDHGVRGACLKYQFAHVGKTTRRWASCDKQNHALHNEAAEGPHAIVEGWEAAALTFVKPADRRLLGF
jgi:hypothetical protein